MKTIKIGKHVKIFRCPWRFGFGISMLKLYPGCKSLHINLGPLTMSIDFYTSKKSKYQTIKKE